MPTYAGNTEVKVFIAADDAAMTEDLENRLKLLGYSICGLATTAETALKMVGQHLPRLVMMDIILPGEIDGLGAAEIIREKWDIPVILLIGPADTDRLLQAKSACPFGYLLKPLHERELQVAVELALQAAIRDRECRKTAAVSAVAEDALRKSEESTRKKLQIVLDPERDLGSLELSDIIDSEAVQSLMDDFYRLTKIGIGVIDLNGKILVATGWQDICTKFHRVHSETCGYCIESDTELSNGVEPGKFKFYKCKNNMWDIATPIMVGNKHIGNVFLGQFFFEDEKPDRDLFRRQATKYGFDEQAYFQALDQVPRWSRDMVNTVMTFYTKLAQILSSLSLGNFKLARALSEKDALFDRLQESEINYRMLVENSSDIVWKFDPASMTFKFYSNSAERLLGYSPETDQSMTLDDIFSPETKEEVLAAFAKVYRGDSPTDRIRLEAEHRTKNEDMIWLEINAGLQKNDLGQPVSFTGSSRDITERKRAEEELQKSESRLRAIFEHSPLGMILFDPEGTIIDCNDKFAQLMGSTIENSSVSIPPDKAPRDASCYQAGTCRDHRDIRRPVHLDYRPQDPISSRGVQPCESWPKPNSSHSHTRRHHRPQAGRGGPAGK